MYNKVICLHWTPDVTILTTCSSQSQSFIYLLTILSVAKCCECQLSNLNLNVWYSFVIFNAFFCFQTSLLFSLYEQLHIIIMRLIVVCSICFRLNQCKVWYWYYFLTIVAYCQDVILIFCTSKEESQGRGMLTLWWWLSPHLSLLRIITYSTLSCFGSTRPPTFTSLVFSGSSWHECCCPNVIIELWNIVDVVIDSLLASDVMGNAVSVLANIGCHRW